MTIDRYRLNWAAVRKQAIDRHLASLRPAEQPPISIDALVAAFVIVAVVAVLAFLKGYADGSEAARKAPARVEYQNPKTKCSSWDFSGPNGTRHCVIWRRIS